VNVTKTVILCAIAGVRPKSGKECKESGSRLKKHHKKGIKKALCKSRKEWGECRNKTKRESRRMLKLGSRPIWRSLDAAAPEPRIRFRQEQASCVDSKPYDCTSSVADQQGTHTIATRREDWM
jgi:uncharacterized membrane protein